MPYIKSFSINTNRINPFPFNIPAVKFAKHITLESPVAIMVGDNGCGKSTLLESIAYSLNLPLIGGFMREHPSFEAAGLLQPYLNIEWERKTSKGFFFRAEDFSDFVNSVERERSKIAGDLQELKGEVDDSIITRMSESMNYKFHLMRQHYGENMQTFSHGEAYLKILQTRISGKGLYLLDEPESALSPLKQLALLSFIKETVSQNDAQFIIATHSPIIMGLPDATLYQIQENSIEKVSYRETEHYSITRNFLENPEQFIKYL